MATRSVSVAVDREPGLIVVCRLHLVCNCLGQYLTPSEIHTLEGAARSVSIDRDPPLIVACALPLVCEFLGQYLTPSEIHTLESVHWWISADLRWHILASSPAQKTYLCILAGQGEMCFLQFLLRSIMQRGFLNNQSDGIFGGAGRKRESPGASTGSSGATGTAGTDSSGPVASTDSSGPVASTDSSGPAASTSTGSSATGPVLGAAAGSTADDSSVSGADAGGDAGQGGFGPYSQEQVEHFKRQLKHMDMMGIDVYVTDFGAILDRDSLRQIIKRSGY
ncbi:unnamed protein product [Symbiodinium sp. CCMP2592]|nr:unnamed protein product [Symbiodinium sp. CCMP2592]CAE7484447.1 unnamed protein product [Symbiodinium sp. CCMP2592]CAE7830307.1 unnamed protein product [Symbiodinium sp. CCMP2592]